MGKIARAAVALREFRERFHALAALAPEIERLGGLVKAERTAVANAEAAVAEEQHARASAGEIKQKHAELRAAYHAAIRAVESDRRTAVNKVARGR